jgi:hypothetical protein
MTGRRRDRALALATSIARAGKDAIKTMTAPLPNPPAGPTAADLRAQRPALLEQIEVAKTAITAARAEHAKAQAAFDKDENSETHAQALWLAEQRGKTRERKLQELQDQLEAHDAATKAAERRDLERRADAIRAELSHNADQQGLDGAATAAALLVSALLRIREHNAARQELRLQLHGIENTLGRQPTEDTASVHGHRVEALWVLVAERIRALAQGDTDPARRGYLLALAQAPIDLRPS